MHCTNVGNLMQIRSGFDALWPKVRLAPQVRTLVTHLRLAESGHYAIGNLLPHRRKSSGVMLLAVRHLSEHHRSRDSRVLAQLRTLNGVAITTRKIARTKAFYGLFDALQQSGGSHNATA